MIVKAACSRNGSTKRAGWFPEKFGESAGKNDGRNAGENAGENSLAVKR